MKSLCIIGAGRVGKTLGRLFARAGAFQVVEVRSNRLENAQAAVAFIGAGEPTSAASPLRQADVFMLTVPDDRIATVAACLRQADVVKPDTILFHCSGALSSRDMPLLGTGLVASVHPAKSFVNVEAAVQTFPGCWCACEGTPSALEVLQPAFEAIGAQTFAIEAEKKMLYHIGCVFGCNYLTALLDVARGCLENAGVPAGQSLQILQPLIEETVHNNVALGSTRALTGPIARGDAGLVEREVLRLEAECPEWAAAYRLLGKLSADIAGQGESVSPDALQLIRQSLELADPSDV